MKKLLVPFNSIFVYLTPTVDETPNVRQLIIFNMFREVYMSALTALAYSDYDNLTLSLNQF